MGEIFGRDDEIKVLENLLKSKKSEFLALWGRRRVGKTYLVDRFFRSKGLYFHFTGMKGASLKEHLEIFHYNLNERFEIDFEPATSWVKAFLNLRSAISDVDTKQQVVLFFDEVPWIATRRSGFLKALEHFWNDYLSRRGNALLIVCGSAASWMIEKIVKNKGGLHNRLTEKMCIEPFSITDTKRYLQGVKIDLSKKQLIDLYMVTGGVAQYLTYVKRGQSSAQMIQKLCFEKNSPLLGEYDVLFASLFENSHNHLVIIEILAQHKGGLTHSQLLKKTGLPSGGSFTVLLNELKEAGFINHLPPYNKQKKDARLYLCDEYCLFYHSWIKKYRPKLKDHFWLDTIGSTRYLTWSGLAFESICKKHLNKIIEALGIQLVAIDAVYWRAHDGSCQIDLIIDRKDNTMNLCEIKFYNAQVVFDSKDAQAIAFRKERFRELTKSKKTLLSTLISVYGAKENQSFFEAFDNQVVFEELV